jgi:purine-binding chemotaxis protein CheW
MTETDILAFRLDGRLFGLEAASVQDVFHPKDLTEVPLADPDILGVLNLRGRIVTALCLRRRLGLPDRTPGAPPPRAIGVELQGDAYGLVVDAVEGVLKLDTAEMLPPPQNLSASWKRTVAGLFRLESELLVLLTPQALVLKDAQAA